MGVQSGLHLVVLGSYLSTTLEITLVVLGINVLCWEWSLYSCLQSLRPGSLSPLLALHF